MDRISIELNKTEIQGEGRPRGPPKTTSQITTKKTMLIEIGTYIGRCPVIN